MVAINTYCISYGNATSAQHGERKPCNVMLSAMMQGYLIRYSILRTFNCLSNWGGAGGDPDLIMIDEPTEGLSPQMVERTGDLLKRIAERGIAILLVEQKLTIAMRISHRLYVMGHGRIVFEGTPADLRANEPVRKEWLEV